MCCGMAQYGQFSFSLAGAIVPDIMLRELHNMYYSFSEETKSLSQ